MSLRDQLQSIYDSRGVLTPTIVVDEARPSESPLHSHFEWDDTVAGEAWRREQARHLIGSVRIVYRAASGRSEDRSVRAFHAVPDPESAGYRYEPAETVAADPVLRELVLRDMEREWKSLKARFGHMAEFVKLVSDDLHIDKAA